MSKKHEREPWATLQNELNHAAHSARACAGLDMSGVPEGAVRELVEVMKIVVSYPLDVRHIPWMEDAEKTLAPFVKEG
jgi:hypothetical protein